MKHVVSQTAEALSERNSIPEDVVKGILNHWLFRVSPQERQDVLQDSVVRLLTNEPSTPGLVYVVVRGAVLDHFKKERYRKHVSLHAPISSDPDAPLLSETLLGGSIDLATLGDGALNFSQPFTDNFEQSFCDAFDTINLWATLPQDIRDIAYKRLSGWTISSAERQKLHRWKRSATN